MPVQDRVAAELRGIAWRHGRRCRDGWRVDVPLTQDLLGSLVGATRESVNRALRHLRHRGVVRRVGRCYVVADGERRALDDAFGDVVFGVPARGAR